MIRDPSDGTVRESNPVSKRLREWEAEVGIPATKPVVKDSLTTPDTGLRQPTRTDAQERLDRSRDWVREFHAKKEREHAGDRGADTAPNGSLRDDSGRPE